jgi:hypothetical protein
MHRNGKAWLRCVRRYRCHSNPAAIELTHSSVGTEHHVGPCPPHYRFATAVGPTRHGAKGGQLAHPLKSFLGIPWRCRKTTYFVSLRARGSSMP